MSDVWRFRELFLFLAWRDLLVRYKQTVVGVAWSFIRPLITMIILSLVFGKLGGMPSGSVPYPLLVLCGILPWQFFATGLSDSGNSLVANAGLISKIYFPRLIIPAGTIVAATVDFLVGLALLVMLMFWYRWTPPATVVLLPVFMALAAIVSFGAGVWIAALTIQYRDFRVLVPFAIQIGLYVSPVGFSSSLINDNYRAFFSINPMVGVIDGFRWCLLGGQHTIYWPSVALSLVLGILLLSTGVRYFIRTERTFADVI